MLHLFRRTSLPPRSWLTLVLRPWRPGLRSLPLFSPIQNLAIRELSHILVITLPLTIGSRLRTVGMMKFSRKLSCSHFIISYLLSPSSSSLGGAGSGSARAVLLGSADPSKTPGFHKNSDPFIFTEIAEFALSLTPNKGQDPFSGLAHLQAYRLIRASQLAEVGYTSMANRCGSHRFVCYFVLDHSIGTVRLSVLRYVLMQEAQNITLKYSWSN